MGRVSLGCSCHVVGALLLRLIATTLRSLLYILVHLQAGFGKNCSIYVTSDSEPAQELLLKHIREQQPTIHASSATGAPVHVDKSSIAAEDRSALLKSYVDWEVLRRMDRLAVSRSGYGETAAWTAAVPATCMSTDDHKLFPFDTIIGPYVGW